MNAQAPFRVDRRGFRLLSWLLPILISGGVSAANNCLPGDFLDRRGYAEILIANNDPLNPTRYRPRCVTISESTTVRFAATPNFGNHPLYGGIVEGGIATIDPNSPIGSATSANQTEVERLLIAHGEFPFFCDFHFSSGMMGSIRVVPELFANGFDLE